ncbi:hypothetical protein IKW75_03560 [Candidatus Saccharibacteria bacterium]|nr:hypothetical protein [Candidatus Saccharibacteria bacterium]
MTKPKIIFFGNGPLANFTKETLEKSYEIVFHAREKADLETVKSLKSQDPNLHGVLASFGVMIKNDVLDLFEPEGILNIHPSMLPNYRGASPIETAILRGDKIFGVSVMKLVLAMDAGPTYHQTELSESEIFEQNLDSVSCPDYKTKIYRALATVGAEWINKNITSLPEPKEQLGEPTFTEKFDKSMSLLDPDHKTAAELLNQIRAFSGFPKSKYVFSDLNCTIVSAHVATATEIDIKNTLYIQCFDDSRLIIDQIQPESRKIMDAKSFLNGYLKK